MSSITPDILQWVLMDEKVIQKWRNLARRLDLSEHILDIECMRGTNRRGRREQEKLQMLLTLWREKRGSTYNINTLKTLLAEEGLNDMWMWINIITRDNKSMLRSRSVSDSKEWSRHSKERSLLSLSSSTLPSSYRKNLCSSPNPSHESFSYSNTISATPFSTSRPNSQMSDISSLFHNSYSPIPTILESPGDGDIEFLHPSSCEPSQYSSPSSSSPSLRSSQSPDIDPLASRKPYRSSHSPSLTPSKQGVYSTLYRPDLLKMSSCRRANKNSSGVVSSRHNDTGDISKKCSTVCDELLNELETDFEQMKSAHRKTKVILKTLPCEKKLTAVDLEEAKHANHHNDKTRKTNDEYFNNLLFIIEQAKEGLTL